MHPVMLVEGPPVLCSGQAGNTSPSLRKVSEKHQMVDRGGQLVVMSFISVVPPSPVYRQVKDRLVAHLEELPQEESGQESR